MIRMGIVGCGHWGPNHVRNFSSLSGVTVCAVADPKEEALARIHESFPAVRLEREPGTVINDSTIDAVVVATPTSTHYRVVKAALAAGKHVLCEKPLCERSTEAGELVQIAKQKGLILMVGHVFLFNSGISKMRELITAIEFGRLLYLSAVRTNLGPIRTDVNVVADLVSHDVAIFNWILGTSPTTVTAAGGAYLQPGIEDVVFATLRYPNDVLASIQASWLNPRKVRQITAVGSSQMVTWDDLDLRAPISIYDCGARAEPEYREYGDFLRVAMWDGEIRLPKITSEEPLKAQAREFVRAVANGQAPRSDGVFGAAVVRVIESINESTKLGGASVRVNP